MRGEPQPRAWAREGLRRKDTTPLTEGALRPPSVNYGEGHLVVHADLSISMHNGALLHLHFESMLGDRGSSASSPV